MRVSDHDREVLLSTRDLQETDELREPLVRGQQVGWLSYDEVSHATSELELGESEVAELLLERAEIETRDPGVHRGRRAR
jgi:hypothetical protein